MARRSFGQQLGERMRAQREARGLSQAKAAELAGATPNFIGLIERGQKLPTIDTLVRIARALKVEPGELLGASQVSDDWVDQVLAVASTVPKPLRPIALAVLKAVAAGS